MKRKIGAHVSASGGLEKAIERAYNIGANCAQIFSGSPRVWKRAQLTSIDTNKMFSKRDELLVKPIFTHSLYLLNLASDKPELLRKSFDALQYDLQFDSYIQGSGVVVHLGSHTGRGWDAVKQQVAQQITDLLAATPTNSKLLIENSAGQKGKLCSDLSEIRWLFDQVSQLTTAKNGSGATNNLTSRLGWCLDTCHAHAAGYWLGLKANPEEVSQLESSGFNLSLATEISRLKLWETLSCIHVNDSRDSFGSGRDRHENLGVGNIPQESLRYFLNLETVLSIPIITEVPGFEGLGPDKQNIEYLKKVCGE